MTIARGLTIQRLTIAILFSLLFAMAARIPTDSDVWWHLRSGEYIVEQQTIPTTGIFSHTRSEQDWVNHSWGAQVIIYSIYRLFGGDRELGDSGNVGLAVYMAALATLGMAFVYLMCEGNAYVRAFVVVLGAAAAAVFWSPRPQMISFALSTVVLYLLHLYKRKQLDRLWLIPIITAVWANLHGGYAIGFIFMFGTLIGEVFGNLLDKENAQVIRWPRLRKLGLVIIISTLAVIVNPYGPQMLLYPFRTVSIGALQDFIQEWASPNFHERQNWPFALLLLGVLAAAGLGSRHLDWTDLVLVCGTAFLALTAGRNIAMFAVVATPVLARHVDSWLTERGWQIQPMQQITGRMLALNWVLLGIVLLGSLAKVAVVLDGDLVRKAQRDYFPVEAAAFLDKTPLPGLMFNSYNWGGYLLFAAPDVPVYIDGRTDLYDDAFIRGYLDIVFAHTDWQQALDEQKIGFVVIESDSVLATMLRNQPDQWKEYLFDGERSAIFVRVAGDTSSK